MKDSRRSNRTRTSSARLVTTSPSSSRAPATPSDVVKASAKRIVDKMQLLALRRPNMLHLLEILIDGMLCDRRRDDRHSTLDD